MSAPRPPGEEPQSAGRGQNGPTPPPGRKRPRFPLWYALVGLLLVLLIQWAATSTRYEEISYGKFRQLLAEGTVQSAVLVGDKVRGELAVADAKGRTRGFVATLVPGDESLFPLLQEKLGEDWDRRSSWLESPLLYWLVPLIVLFFLWRMLLGRSSPMRSVMDFSQSRANVVAQQDVGITFEDVAGIEECKQELMEIVEFLRNPSRFTRLGGRIPKGVLLIGPPGTGKTLLAKAVAGEAEVTFFSLSGSDFVEMFVGVGAARVRDLFEQANKNAPSIIFIDELDALGKTRGAGLMGGHDEREQTLNALLVQMDGFTTQKGVILLAATNRPEMLDPALLRPGRFDRQVVVSPPDLKDREAILELHAKNVKLGPDVDLHRLAAMTPGFVGADLANLVNEATLLAARRDQNEVRMKDVEDSIERVVAGLEKRNRLMNEQEKEIVAHHEAGHALAASLLPGSDRVRKVSMIPRGAAALGYTMQMPTEDRYLMRKDELMDRLTIMLGGRSAEEVMFGETSTGAQNDLQKATELAREMVTEFGMSEELGPLSYGRRVSPFGLPGLTADRGWSEHTTRQVDQAIRALVEEAHERAVELLRAHREALADVAAALKEKEVLGEEELADVLSRHGIGAAPDTAAPAGPADAAGDSPSELAEPDARQEPVPDDHPS